MKKYIVIATLILSNTAWSMDYEKHSPKTTHSPNLKELLHSFPTMDDKEKGWHVIDTINQNASSRTPKTNQVTANCSNSRLFVHSSKL